MVVVKDLEGNILFQGDVEYLEDFIPEIIGVPVTIDTEVE